MKVFLFLLFICIELFPDSVSELYLKCKEEMNSSCEVETLTSLMAKKDALAIKVNDDIFTPTNVFKKNIEEHTISLEKKILTLIRTEIKENGAGKATLTEYNADESLMSLSLQWNQKLDTLISLKKLSQKVSLEIEAKSARSIFEKKRTHPFYIDISYNNHQVKIGQMYIEDKGTKYIFSSSNSTTNKKKVNSKHITTINNKMWQDEPYTDKEDKAYDANNDFGKAGRWNYAKKYCKNSKLGGYTDWRLPTKSELQALYKKKSQLKNVRNSWYWTSTKSNDTGASFWIVGFDDGYGYWGNDGSSSFVRCVRQ